MFEIRLNLMNRSLPQYQYPPLRHSGLKFSSRQVRSWPLKTQDTSNPLSLKKPPIGQTQSPPEHPASRPYSRPTFYIACLELSHTGCASAIQKYPDTAESYTHYSGRPFSTHGYIVCLVLATPNTQLFNYFYKYVPTRPA